MTCPIVPISLLKVFRMKGDCLCDVDELHTIHHYITGAKISSDEEPSPFVPNPTDSIVELHITWDGINDPQFFHNGVRDGKLMSEEPFPCCGKRYV